ncbi:MAG TPA: TldD/PmbA family protein, partial [Nitriliruptorales bacterium]|nr:TldD/PmbA family protein [Nitriliruptorales bacterium]
YAQAAVEAATAAGATYADARAMVSRNESLEARDGQIESLRNSESGGLGVRALIGGSWGFFATNDLTDEAARGAGVRAAETARASATVPFPDVRLADVPVAEDHYATPYEEDPFAVGVSDKADLLVGVTGDMRAVEGVAVARASLEFWSTEKWFVSSQGHRISQHLVESGGGMSATAVGERETQRRSYPQSFGQYQTGGYEIVRGFDLPGNALRVADEAVALLTADECPSGERDLILESSQLALQIHESVGHAIELDRILGWEAAFAGTSFLDLPQLGSLRYGSALMNITADATLPGALGTFGYDDEGTPAQRVDIVREGTWVGVLSGRDSAHIAGLPPGGMVRGDGFNRLPMVRMTNVGLLPGDASLDEIVDATEDGILMATNRSWSIDDKRLNFQFGCEVGWEVRHGRLGRMLRNPTYTGITPQFWARLDMLAGGDEWRLWGTPNCGKGQPMQVAHTAHPAAPARFRGIRVGVRA